MIIRLGAVARSFRLSSWNGVFRKGTVLLILLSFFASSGHIALAQQPLTPRFNIEGNWNTDPNNPYDRPIQCLRQGFDVSCISVDTNYAHRIDGIYINPTQIAGSVMRRNRQSGCVTYMDVLITFSSNSLFTLKWTDRDGRCDLKKDQQGTDSPYHRMR